MKAEEKNDISYVVKGNALKRKSIEKKAEIGRSCNCSLLTFPLIHVFFIRDPART